MMRLSSCTLIAALCFVQFAYAKLVRFNVTLTWDDWEEGPGAPRKMIFANKQFPSPLLELNQGDDVEFHVSNAINRSTSVHFHGIEQMNTPWSDGVPGLSQKPIPPGGHFLYKWKAYQYGSYMYHAHLRGQIEDGLVGPIYIRPAKSVGRPFHLITNDSLERRNIERAERRTSPIMLSDWRQLTSEQSWSAEKATGLDSYCVNALLINGKGSIKCLDRETLNKYTTPAQRGLLGAKNLTDTGCMPPIQSLEGSFAHNYGSIRPTMYSGCKSHQGPSEVLHVKSSDRYVSYDLISSASTNTLMFSIDEHKMYVYAVDGRYVEPIKVDALSLANGNRYSVIVDLDKPAGDYTVRLATVGVNQILNSTATLSYENPSSSAHPSPKKHTSIPSIDLSGTNTTADTVILDDTAIVPFPIEVPSETVAQTHILRVGRYNTSYHWTLGNSSYDLALENSHPLLFTPNSSFGHSDLTVRSLNGTWVDIIFDVFNAVQPPHPIHKHSNKFFVIGQGEGAWNYSSVAEAMEYIPESFNLKTPQMRDTYITPAAATGPTWLALRYQVVNPGAFLLHCHIQVHLSGGMALALLDGIDKWPEIPTEYRKANSIR